MNRHLALLLAILGLTLGPVLAGALTRWARLYAALDGFVLFIVGALCLGHLLPHAFESLGPVALPLAAAGFLLPLLSERWLHRRQGGGEVPIVMAVALAGLSLHATLDGAALALAGHPAASSAHHALAGAAGQADLDLTLAILAHRLPVGLLIWWTVLPSLGRRVAVAMLGVLALATTLGFLLSHEISVLGGGHAAGVVNALLAGGLLHVILDHGPAPAGGGRHPAASALGALIGVGLIAILPLEPIPGAPVALDTIRRLLLESSPALLLGFLGAGLLSLVPAGTVTRLMTGRGNVTSSLRGLAFGLPLPICSCGVVPLYRGLVRKGVPAAAAITFLVAAPELGIDSILVSVPLLGAHLTLIRLGAAAAVALVAGVVAGVLTAGSAPAEAEGSGREAGASGCADACADDAPRRGGRVAQVLRYGFVDAMDDLGPWILAGILVAGVLVPAVPRELLSSVPRFGDVPALAALAAPFYVCASAATPLGAVLLAKGVGAGAVVAFLLVGPATNLATYGALRTAYGRRISLAILGAILAASVLLGLGIDLLPLHGGSPALAGSHHAGWVERGSAGIFLLLALGSLIRQGPRGFLGRLGLAHEHDHDAGGGGHRDAGHRHPAEHDGPGARETPDPHRPAGLGTS